MNKITQLQTSQSSLEKSLETEDEKLNTIKSLLESELRKQQESQKRLLHKFQNIQTEQSRQNPIESLEALRDIIHANISTGTEKNDSTIGTLLGIFQISRNPIGSFS